MVMYVLRKHAYISVLINILLYEGLWLDDFYHFDWIVNLLSCHWTIFTPQINLAEFGNIGGIWEHT